MKFCIALAVTALTCLSAWAADLLAPAEVDAWLEKHPGTQIVDVRTPEEFAEGHIKGAKLMNWNAGDFQTRAKAELDPSKPVFLICRSGRRSTAAAKAMEKLGFTQLAELRGGMLAWNKAGLPIQVPKP